MTPNQDKSVTHAPCRSKQVFADGEVRVGESNGGMARLDVDGRGLLVDVDRDGVVFHLRRDAQVAQDFPGEDPGFEFSVLLAQESTSGAEDREGFDRGDVCVDEGLVGLAYREGWDWSESLRGGYQGEE